MDGPQKLQRARLSVQFQQPKLYLYLFHPLSIEHSRGMFCGISVPDKCVIMDIAEDKVPTLAHSSRRHAHDVPHEGADGEHEGNLFSKSIFPQSLYFLYTRIDMR